MSYKLRQNPAHPNNFTFGRQGQDVNKLVIHHAATTDFDGIARTFQNGSRGASAHYGVGRNNNVDQYVQDGNTAWHCANWQGNLTSIGIENVNKTGGPNWLIDDATFATLVELCRDLAKRHGLGKLVVGKNLFGHKDFVATACPDKLYARLKELAKKVNESDDDGGAVVVPKPARRTNEQIATEVLAGAWGNGPERKNRLESAGYDYGVIQQLVNARLSGSKPAPARPSNDKIADQVIAGAWGVNPQRAARLKAAGYDADAIQALVNKKLGAGPSAPKRKSNDQVAAEIVAGVGGWGNNPQRAERLAKAGYNASEVQKLVNKKLGY